MSEPCRDDPGTCHRDACTRLQECMERAACAPVDQNQVALDVMRVREEAAAKARLDKAMEDLKPALLLVLLARLKGRAVVPCSEIDEAAGYRMTMQFNPSAGNFTFKLEKKE